MSVLISSFFLMPMVNPKVWAWIKTIWHNWMHLSKHEETWFSFWPVQEVGHILWPLDVTRHLTRSSAVEVAQVTLVLQQVTLVPSTLLMVSIVPTAGCVHTAVVRTLLNSAGECGLSLTACPPGDSRQYIFHLCLCIIMSLYNAHACRAHNKWYHVQVGQICGGHQHCLRVTK